MLKVMHLARLKMRVLAGSRARLLGVVLEQRTQFFVVVVVVDYGVGVLKKKAGGPWCWQ